MVYYILYMLRQLSTCRNSNLQSEDITMEHLIELAKSLGKEIQKDERYLAFRKASEANDADTELQNLIGQFNLKRLDLGNEEDKPEPDEARVHALNEEMKDLYSQIMANSNMRAYQGARGEFEQMLDSINRIIAMSAAGQDPDSYDPTAEHSCSGNCSSCGGCH